MELSKAKVLAFFIVLLSLGWFLYPKSLFLGFIQEGLSNLEHAENHYKTYLERNPHHKFATLRLARLYYQMATPERATPLLKELHEYRYLDWDVVQAYMSHLREIHDMTTLYEVQKQTIKDFADTNRIHRAQKEKLLKETFETALFEQKLDDAYKLSERLMAISKDPAKYEYEKLRLDMAFQKTDKVLVTLKRLLKQHPKNESVRLDLIQVLVVAKEEEEALKIATDGLDLNPKSTELLKSRIAINERLQRFEEAIKDTKALIAILEQDRKPTSTEETKPSRKRLPDPKLYHPPTVNPRQ